jgi:hypothetical protein
MNSVPSLHLVINTYTTRNATENAGGFPGCDVASDIERMRELVQLITQNPSL